MLETIRTHNSKSALNQYNDQESSSLLKGPKNKNFDFGLASNAHIKRTQNSRSVLQEGYP